MKKLKYFAILMIVGIFTLTGCGGKKLPVEERLEKALINLAKADSFTAKAKVTVSASGQKVNVGGTVKVAKEDEYYNLYLNVSYLNQNFIETYLLTSKKKMQLYYSVLGDDWKYVDSKYDDVDDELNIDASEYTQGVDEKDIKNAIKSFKKIKEGKTKDGITEIIVTIDADELSESLASTGAKVEDDYTISFFVDKKNNLTGIEMNFDDVSDDVDSAKLTIEIKDINNTTVKVPSKVKKNAEEIDAEDLFSDILGMFMPSYIDDDDYDFDYDDDDDYSYDYESDDIMHDILLSAYVKTCEDGMVIDFKNYNDELTLYDDEYDIKRIEDGEITFTKVNGACDFEITRPIIIDGKTCTITSKEFHNGECK